MNPSKILGHFNSRQNAIIESIREIVEIETPSRDVENSKAVVDWIVAKARDISPYLQIERIAAENYGEHLVIRAFPAKERSILLLGHTDTVHPVGTKAENPTRIGGDKFYGCGIFDMKANVVLMLETLRFFAETELRPARPITILLSCDEEIGSYTGRGLVEREAKKVEMCLVLEPSAEGRVKTGRKGTGMFTVKTHGTPAHAGLEPEKGSSAILELSKQIERIHSLNNLSKGTTVNVCTVKGGTTTNVIPEHAECSVDVRFSSMGEAVRIERELRNLRVVDKRVSLEIVGGVNRPPMERTEKVADLFKRARNIAAGFDYVLGETRVGGASDGNFVAALGVPVLDGLGISGDGAHTLHEHILISDIAKRAALVTVMLMEDGGGR